MYDFTRGSYCSSNSNDSDDGLEPWRWMLQPNDSLDDDRETSVLEIEGSTENYHCVPFHQLAVSQRKAISATRPRPPLPLRRTRTKLRSHYLNSIPPVFSPPGLLPSSPCTPLSEDTCRLLIGCDWNWDVYDDDENDTYEDDHGSLSHENAGLCELLTNYFSASLLDCCQSWNSRVATEPEVRHDPFPNPPHPTEPLPRRKINHGGTVNDDDDSTMASWRTPPLYTHQLVPDQPQRMPTSSKNYPNPNAGRLHLQDSGVPPTLPRRSQSRSSILMFPGEEELCDDYTAPVEEEWVDTDTSLLSCPFDEV